MKCCGRSVCVGAQPQPPPLIVAVAVTISLAGPAATRLTLTTFTIAALGPLTPWPAIPAGFTLVASVTAPLAGPFPTGTARPALGQLPQLGLLLFGQDTIEPRVDFLLQGFELLDLLRRQPQSLHQHWRQDLTGASTGAAALESALALERPITAALLARFGAAARPPALALFRLRPFAVLSSGLSNRWSGGR